MSLSEHQLILIKEMENHVFTINSDAASLSQELIDHFPEFIYEGPAFRAIRGEWAEGFINISWALSEQAALTACRSWIGEEKPIYVYQAEVRGFDLDLFMQHLIKHNLFSFHEKVVLYHQKEREILSLEFSGRELVSVVKD